MKYESVKESANDGLPEGVLGYYKYPSMPREWGVNEEVEDLLWWQDST